MLRMVYVLTGYSPKPSQPTLSQFALSYQPNPQPALSLQKRRCGIILRRLKERVHRLLMEAYTGRGLDHDETKGTIPAPVPVPVPGLVPGPGPGLVPVPGPVPVPAPVSGLLLMPRVVVLRGHGMVHDLVRLTYATVTICRYSSL